MFATRSAIFSVAISAALLVPTLASAANRVVTINNKTKSTIVAFHASTTGTSTWDEDILGSDTLAPGESIDIDIDDGSGACKYDLMAKFKDGTDAVSNNLNVCTTDEFDFTE